MKDQIIVELIELLEKSGTEDIPDYDPSTTGDQPELLETAYINVKAVNARYDKNDALRQVQTLMEKYNIQIDELMERIS